MFFTEDADEVFFNIDQDSKPSGHSTITEISGCNWFIINFGFKQKGLQAATPGEFCSKLVSHVEDIEAEILYGIEKGWILNSVVAIVPPNLANTPRITTHLVDSISVAENYYSPYGKVYIIDTPKGEYLLQTPGPRVSVYRKQMPYLNLMKFK